MYVNDLPKAVRQCQMKQYADDTTMSHAANSAIELEAVLEKDLNDEWVDENKLMLNAKKTQLLLLGKKSGAQELQDVSVTLNGEQLALVHRCVTRQGPEYMRDVFVSNETAGCWMTRGFQKLPLPRKHRAIQEIICI